MSNLSIIYTRGRKLPYIKSSSLVNCTEDFLTGGVPSADATSRLLLGVKRHPSGPSNYNRVRVCVRAKTGDRYWSLRNIVDYEKEMHDRRVLVLMVSPLTVPVVLRGNWSGTVVLQDGDEDSSFVLLSQDCYEAALTPKQNRGTVSKLQVQAKGWWEWDTMEPKFCPYEVDLLSYMFTTKPF
jgi:hypothetical protein